MELSKREIRQINNLSKICEFDMQKKSVLVHLHYSTPEELLDIHLGCPEKPVVSDETVEYLCDIISSVPKKFSVEFALKIDDYGKYVPERLMSALNKTIENTFYFHDESGKKNNILAIIFLIVGIIILAFSTVGGTAGWLGSNNSIERNIITTILEVFIWAFIWEGAALLFLTYEKESTVFSSNMRRFFGVRFLDKENTFICGLTEEQFYEGWIYLSGKEAFARNYILFSNAALLALLCVKFFELIVSLGPFSALELIFTIVYGALIIMLVMSNISFYRDNGHLKKFAPILSIIVLILSIISIVYFSIQSKLTLKYILGDLILAIDLVINVLCLYYMKGLSAEVE